MCLFQFWFPQCVCPAVGLLGRMAVQFLIFKWISTLFSSSFFSLNSPLVSPFLQMCQLDGVSFHFLSIPLVSIVSRFPICSELCLKSFPSPFELKLHFLRKAFPDASVVGWPTWEIISLAIATAMIAATTTIITHNIYWIFLCNRLCSQHFVHIYQFIFKDELIKK